MECDDASNATKPASTGLTISIYDSGNSAPKWDQNFPRNITLYSLQPGYVALDTPAIDSDQDKATNGRITYQVKEIDKSPVVIGNGVNDFMQYGQGGNSSKLYVVYTLPWEPESVHTVNVTAQDHVRRNKP